MKFVLLVEGDTEKKVLNDFLKRWLDPRLTKSVGIKIDNSKSWSTLVRDAPAKVEVILRAAKSPNEVIAVIGLMDLYGPEFYPEDKKTISERYAWAKWYMEDQVENNKFRQHFAVHETEAWLLSDPGIFPDKISKALPTKIAQPETVNFNEPPAKLLDKLYEEKTKRGYNKVADGKELFKNLNPQTAYEKCPYLKMLLDEMLTLARDAGL